MSHKYKPTLLTGDDPRYPLAVIILIGLIFVIGFFFGADVSIYTFLGLVAISFIFIWINSSKVMRVYRELSKELDSLENELHNLQMTNFRLSEEIKNSKHL